MTEFLLAISLFIIAHVVPPVPSIRAFLIALIGRPLYILGYSLLSLALLAWIIVAARRAPYISLWDPAPWQAVITLALMPLAFWLVIAGLAEPNPLSITLRRASPEFLPGPVVTITRHPVLWGFRDLGRSTHPGQWRCCLANPIRWNVRLCPWRLSHS